jgi:fructosamine-3-kinase
MDSNVFPWLKRLPGGEQDDFLQEFMGLGSAGVEMGWSIETFAGKLEAHITKYMAQVQDQPDETDPMKEFEELTGLKASEGVPVAKVKSLSAVTGTFMWLAYLPADEQEQFWWELYTAMDEVHATRPHQQFGVYVAKAVGPVLHAWKATAQAHADGLPEILATATMEDFGEVQRPKGGSVRDRLMELVDDEFRDEAHELLNRTFGQLQERADEIERLSARLEENGDQ